MVSKIATDDAGARRNDRTSESRKRSHGDTSPGHKRKKLKKGGLSTSANSAEDEIDQVLRINKSIGHMDRHLLADLIARKTRRHEGTSETSELESSSSSIPSMAISDTSAWTGVRDSIHLPDFLEEFVGSRRSPKQLHNAAKALGCPHTLVLAAAGLRAADLTRSLRKFQNESAKVAKLFAKHIKLKEAIESAKKTRMNIGVGTPQRVGDLLDDGALSLDNLERIVVDASHVNEKNQNIFDMRETHGQLIQLLARPAIKARYAADKNKIELLFF